MTKIMFIGDIHSNYILWANYLQVHEPTIQVGDNDFGFPHHTPEAIEAIETALENGDHRWIRGNHDNPNYTNSKQIPDGSYDEVLDIFFCGGAYSIDQATRVEGVDWWREEELTYAELQEVIDRYEAAKPRVLVTHDGPTEALVEMFPRMMRNPRDGRTRQALDTMLQIHRPQFHVFGHWHQTIQYTVDDTRFACVGLQDYLFLDLEKENFHK